MKDPASTLPLGPSLPGWMQTIEFSRRPYDFVRECSKQFGDIYTLNIAGLGNTVMFSSPEAVRAIFALPGDGMHNGNDVVRYLLNERSVVFLEGQPHHKTRQVLSTPLNGKALRSYTPRFLESAQRISNTWKEGQQINLHHAFQEITFDAGHDTTSLALSWIMFQVLQRPEVLNRLLDELQTVQSVDGLDASAVDKLPWLGAVLNESLRVTPGAAFVPRRLDQDVEISGVAFH